MKRRLVNLAAAVSLVLCVATVGIWVVSYFVGGWAALWRGERRHVYIGIGAGTVAVKHHTIESRKPVRLVRIAGYTAMAGPVNTIGVTIDTNGAPAFIVGHRPFTSCRLLRIEWNASGQMTASVVGRESVTATTRSDQITIASWLLLVLLSAPFFLVMLQHRRMHKKTLLGLCPACGYDLRATPNRCPECGTVPPAANRGEGASPSRAL